MNTTPLTSVFDVAVIGAGAAGMTAAGACGEAGLSALLIEKNHVAGKKLSITGKGRCNVTNNCTREEFFENVPTNPKFLYTALSRFSPADTIAFFEGLNVPLKTERGRRVFPVSDKAADIVKALENYCVKNSVVRERADVCGIKKENDVFVVSANGGKLTFRAKNVIVATGGKSYPATGSTGDGYAFAAGFGHTVTRLQPSLVPLECADGICGECMGLSLRNTGAEFVCNGKTVFEETGELLFTHFGITGPVVLSASAHLKSFPVTLYLDLKPALDEQTLDRRVLSDFSAELNREYRNSLSALLPSKLIAPFVRMSGVDPSKKVNAITKQERAKIVSLLKRLPLTVTGKRPLDEAVITSGGVKCAEINPSTMESKFVPGLFFAGEVIDVDAYTGGYNLQIAFSTAHAAAHGVSQRK